MSRTHAEAFGQHFNPTILQPAFIDQSQGASYGIGCAEPRRRSRRAFRAATQTGTKACFRSRGGTREVANVALFCSPSRADWAAVHTAGTYADKELAIEARIPRQPSS